MCAVLCNPLIIDTTGACFCLSALSGAILLLVYCSTKQSLMSVSLCESDALIQLVLSTPAGGPLGGIRLLFHCM